MDTKDKDGNVDESTSPHGVLVLGHDFCIHDLIKMAEQHDYEMSEEEAIEFLEVDGDRIANLASSTVFGLMMGVMSEYVQDIQDMHDLDNPQSVQLSTGPQLVSKLVQ